MNILVIAPTNDDLPDASTEIAAIQRHHTAKILSGIVRDSDIAAAVEEASYEVIWWITHGSAAGVLLSDGPLSVAGVGQYVRICDALLCVLNTCESEAIALSIIGGGKADIICTIGMVGNKDAVRLGVLLAGELAYSESYKQAYSIVAPVGGAYRYLSAAVQHRGRLNHDDEFFNEVRSVLYRDKFGRPGLPERVSALESTATSQESRQERLAVRIGDVESEVKDLRSDMDNIVAAVNERWGKGKIVLSPALAFALAFALIILVFLVAFLAWRLGSGGTLDGQVGVAVFLLSDSALYRSALFWFRWVHPA